MNRELLEKANNLRRAGQTHQADEIYDLLLRSEPNNDEFTFCKAMNLSKSDPIRAIQLFDKVREINPNAKEVYGNIATIAVENNLYDLVIPIFNKAINANSNNLDCT